jgi:hypothetical protein
MPACLIGECHWLKIPSIKQSIGQAPSCTPWHKISTTTGGYGVSPPYCQDGATRWKVVKGGRTEKLHNVHTRHLNTGNCSTVIFCFSYLFVSDSNYERHLDPGFQLWKAFECSMLLFPCFGPKTAQSLDIVCYYIIPRTCILEIYRSQLPL